MVDLYSYQGAEPAPLPFIRGTNRRVLHLPNGRSFTGAAITSQALTAAGYTGPHPKPSHDPAAEQQPVWDGEDWVVSARSDAEILAARKVALLAAIKAKVAARDAAGFTYAIPGESPADPHVYAIADKDQNNMLAVQVRFSKGGTNCHGGYWRCSSNHNVAMDDSEVQAFFDAAYAYKMGFIRRAAVLADAVREAANHAALDDIDIDAGSIDGSGGWPENGS